MKTFRMFLVALILLTHSLSVAQTQNPDGRYITTLTNDPNNPGSLYAASYGSGIFYSGNNGESWASINNDLANTWVFSLASDPLLSGNLVAGSWKGIYKTNSNGSSWQCPGMDKVARINAITIGDNGSGNTNIYAGWWSGVYRSTDGGVNWTFSWKGFGKSAEVYALAASPDTAGKLFAGTRHFDNNFYGGVYVSRDFGSNWSPTSLKNVYLTCLTVRPGSPQILYAGTKGNGIFKTLNDGVTWIEINTGLSNLNVYAIAINPNDQGEVYATTEDGIFRSSNNGDSWIEITSNLPTSNIHALTIQPATPEKVIAGTWGHGAFCSSDKGANWVSMNTGLLNDSAVWTKLAHPDLSNTHGYRGLHFDGNECWLLQSQRIFHSPDYPAAPLEVIYENKNFGLYNWDFKKENNKTYGWAVGSSSVGARTTDASGLNWIQMSLGGTSSYTCVSFATSLLGFASGSDHRLHKTVNGGDKWTDAGVGLGVTGVSTLFFLDSKVGYVGTPDPWLAVTTDGGLTWQDAGEISGTVSDIFFLDSNHGWSVGVDINCYLNGEWTYLNNPVDVGLNSVYFINENEGWIVGNKGVILHSVDGGRNWSGQYCGIDETLTDVCFISPKNGYILSYNGNIFHTVNGGTSFLGKAENVLASTRLELHQNSPNPCKISTSITWQSAQSSRQTLKVYDVFGNEVATLADEVRSAGRQSIDFDTEELPAGVYFYQLRADGKVETKKMIISR